LGSSLHWTRIRDIAEHLVEEACRANTTIPPVDSRLQPAFLLLVPADAAAKLQPLLAECGGGAILAGCCKEAEQILTTRPSIRAIITGLRLPDGCFRDLVRASHTCAEPPPVILSIREADGGWTDLLEAGARDVLIEPYDRERVQQVLDGCGIDSNGELRPVSVPAGVLD
jgi:hypothetical protein